MKQLRILKNILKQTGSDKLLFSYFAFILVDAYVILCVEPDIYQYGDALWYCYEILSTTGFGEMTAATTMGRICSFLLTAYSLVIIAVVTGVITNFYLQIMDMKNTESVVHFVDRLEHLPELSKEELEELSEEVKRFRAKR